MTASLLRERNNTSYSKNGNELFGSSGSIFSWQFNGLIGIVNNLICTRSLSVLGSRGEPSGRASLDSLNF